MADRGGLPGVAIATAGLAVGVASAAAAGIFATYRTFNGIEAGTAFLVLMATVKLLETRRTRDVTILAFIAWFLLYAALLRDQGLLQLPWLIGSAFLTTVALMRVHAAAAGAPAPDIARQAAALLLQAPPLALLLFMLFPRLPGPILGHRIRHRRTHRTERHDDTRRRIGPSASGAVAFRVRFTGATARAGGTLLAWSRPARIRRPQLAATERAGVPAQEVQFAGAPIQYQVTLAPHARRWMLALDLPSQWPATRG